MLAPPEAQNAVDDSEDEAPPKSEDAEGAAEDNSVPSVSVLEGDNDDDSRMSGSNEEEEEEEPSYESDYEYHDEDEEGDTTTANRGATAAASLKRKDLPDIDTEDDTLEVELRRSFPRRGNLKSTGLEEEDYATSSGNVNTIRATPSAATATSATCGICHHPESHAPVLDCGMISDWQDLTRDKASGVLPVDPTAITACMHRRVRECQEWLQRMQEQRHGNLTIGDVNHPEFYEAANSPDLVAVDLRRHRWDVEAWKREYARYYRLILELQEITQIYNRGYVNVRIVGPRRADIHREINEIGIHQGMQEEIVVAVPAGNPGPDREYQRHTAAVQSDHAAFLRSTTENTTEAINNNNDEAAQPQEPPADDGAVGVDEHAVAVAASAPTVAASAPMDADDSEDGTCNRRAHTITFTRRRRASATARLASSVRGVVTRMMSAGRTSPTAASPTEATDSTTTETAAAETTIASSETVAEEATSATEESNWICEICTDDEVEEVDRLSMECGHAYCRDCWIQFITAMLEDVQAAGGLLHMTVVCPHQRCRRKLTRRHVEYMVTPPAPPAPVATTALRHFGVLPRPIPPLLQLYDELALNSFVQGHRRTLRWCPGPNCGQVMVVSREGLFLHDTNSRDATNFARCTACHFRYCLQCGENHNHGQPCHLIVPIEGGEPSAAGVTGPAATTGETQEAPPAGEQAQAEAQEVADEKATDKKIRLCPQCKVPIEKNGGCNHMSCKCGHHFCWLCLADMTKKPGHFCGRETDMLDLQVRMADNGGAGVGGHGNNNLGADLERPLELSRMDIDYVDETLQQPTSNCTETVVEDLRQRRQELHRFAHYYNRFLAHGQGQVFAENQCDCLAGRAVDFTRLCQLQNCTDTDFFQLANQRLVASRRMLKYTYCFLYYKLADNAKNCNDNINEFQDADCPTDSAFSASLSISLALFLDHQERLERMTEQLSFLSENALTRTDRTRVVDMVETVDRCMQAVMAFSFEERDTYT